MQKTASETFPAHKPSASTIPTTRVLIATINRVEGDTGIHAHTRSLIAGMHSAAIECEAVSPFTGNPAWLGVFAIRPLLVAKASKSWSLRWHRHWHRIALEQNLRNRLLKYVPSAIIAQCPVSAQAALNVRRTLAIEVPIIAVCHFNVSEATEYRDRGELADDVAFNAILAMEADVLGRVEKVVYVSRWAQNIVEHERGIATRSSSVVWNGVSDNKAITPINRAQLGLEASDVVLINVGSLEPRKNQISLLDLFAKLSRQHPSAKLVLVGDGPDRNAIQQKIAELGLTARVKCLGFRTDVPALLATSDLYVHFARLENCPVVLLEAARAGLPSATVPAGGAAEILDALGAGVLLDPNDLDESAHRLSSLIADADLRRQTGRRAREGFINRFTDQAMLRGYLDAIDSARVALPSAEVG